MAGRRDVQHECERLNRARKVRRADAYRLQQFWERAKGSFLITGGTEASRVRALCEKFCYDMRWSDLPSYVLTTSSLLEREIIRRVEADPDVGFLRVSSPTYRNYHFFYRWSPEDISRFFIQAAEFMRCDAQEMPIYIHAFTAVLSRCYEPGLAALTALAAYSDGQIVQIGKSCGAPTQALEHISHCAQAGVVFRQVLRQVGCVLSSLGSEDCTTGYNLSNAAPKPGGIYLVNVRSQMPELLSAYFSIELQKALDRPYPPRIVLDSLPFLETDPLRQRFREARLRGVETGVSMENAALLGEEGGSGFKSRAILLDGSLTDGDLDALLRPLGSYTHYEPTLSGGRPAKLFSILTESHYSPAQEPGRLRVRPVDTTGFKAVLYGADGGDIVLARKII